jgi:hypothetical protein
MNNESRQATLSWYRNSWEMFHPHVEILPPESALERARELIKQGVHVNISIPENPKRQEDSDQAPKTS